jgi:hypothetical protein
MVGKYSQDLTLVLEKEAVWKEGLSSFYGQFSGGI